jgi:hypothetical protein
MNRYRARILSLLSILGVCATSLPSAELVASKAPRAPFAPLTITLVPANPGPGDTVQIVMDGGVLGDIPLVLVAFDPGPITLPLVGTLNVGLSDLTFYPFPPFDGSGHAEFPCSLDCYAATVGPYYLQAISLRVGARGVSVTDVSEPLVFDIDDDNIQDCNANGVDDDCDQEQGAPDCNDNGVLDECDIAEGTSRDVNTNGIPDECEDCLAPSSVLEPGRWRLKNNDNPDLLAPPAFGLRLDGLLDGDCSKNYTFDLEYPGSEMFVDYDGSVVRISGSAWGGRDIGTSWDPFEQSFVSLDVTFEGAEVGPGPFGLQVNVPAGAPSYGTATWQADGTVVPLSGKASLFNIQLALRDSPEGPDVLCWFDLGDGCEADVPLSGMDGVDTCLCGSPEKGGDEGTWQLGNKRAGQIAPPDYGLRLDGMFGDYPAQYTFDFEHPGAGVYLTWDGSDVRIHGTAFGGLDIGGGWDPLVRSWVSIDVVWEGAIEDSTGCELMVPNGSNVSGKVVWLLDGTEVPLTGASNGLYMLRFFRDATTTDLSTWVMYASGKPGCCQDFNSRYSTGIEDCPR